MPTLGWSVFENLPGAAAANFEMLCRSIVRRHYGQFGDFRALANQPGVEFHLKLSAPCDLGAPPRWYGWQCRWYGLQNGDDLGATRRQHIKEAIGKTEKFLPGITDWVLWTRHVLTKRDQDWFHGLTSTMTLSLWSGAEVEDRLSGPAALLRETYFGELVLTPELLIELHEQAVAPIQKRWLPEVHQVLDAEREVHRTLGEIDAWTALHELMIELDADIAAADSNITNLPGAMRWELQTLIARARNAHSALSQSYELLKGGQYEVLAQEGLRNIAPNQNEQDLLRRLRSGRQPVALHITNMLADMKRAQRMLSTLDEALGQKLLVVVADAGCGKTQMSAQITAATAHRSAGLLLRGKHLSAGQTLNEFAHRISIRGKPVESFEALVAAVDGAGQRQGKRLPIVIDGLNEAEDPRDWKDQLASLTITLARYANVQVICTLRSAFASDALPDAIEQLEIPGFAEDIVEAVRRYFRHYKIDAVDAELPWNLLNHPLTLRIFCDVTNPDRKQIVGVAAIPGSLGTLFERYLEQVATRIAELAPSTCRYFQSDVRTALNKIGLALWRSHSRDIGIPTLRELLGDESHPWDQSIVAALEQDGILFREPSRQTSQGNMSIVFDALAGHVIADALLGEYSGNQFDDWLRESTTSEALTTGAREGTRLVDLISRSLAKVLPEKWALAAGSKLRKLRKAPSYKHHPLANDIFRALVGLTPYRTNRKQLWPLLKGKLRTDALIEAAYIDSAFLDQDTVSQLATLVREPQSYHRDLLNRLFVTRGAQSHPLNANFLQSVLHPMSMADRDLRWSEWIRRQESMMDDLQRMERRWKNGNVNERGDQLRARWVMWTLTSTNRLLRDHATCALYWFGCNDPNSLFDLGLDSLGINDPYVPERVLASCYGISMSLWADPRGAKVREFLPRFAKALIERMFAPGAPHSTFHALTRGYALGTIALARKIDSNCVSTEELAWLTPPFAHLPSPFPAASAIGDAEIMGADAAISMDFGNYTLGGLIRNRSNYDFDNATYKEVRRQIECRVVNLGYSPKRFGTVDKVIASSGFYSESRGRSKTDRYGKKYSWIAYFEMYGIRADRGEISEWRDTTRPSDADIDPSFPEPPRTFRPTLINIFSTAPVGPRAWISKGPTPDYGGLLELKEIDGIPGPWVLLQGYIEESAPADSRRVFSFLRGILVSREQTSRILDTFNALEYPGNSAIPEPTDDHYTYAGEIPWSEHFAMGLRDSDGKAKPDVREAFDHHDGQQWLPGIPVEVPAYDFAWESYHSELNQIGSTSVLAPALCEKLQLSNRRSEWDLYDPSGHPATIYRQFKDDNDTFHSNLLFLRADLMASYLGESLDLVWLVWGERNLQYKDMTNMRDELRDAFAGHQHIHRFSRRWEH